MNKQPPSILIIKSANTELSKVEKFIRAIFSYYNFSDKCFNAVYLCISEAITNSIVHGNKEDCRKKVELSVDCITNLIKVKITDEGEGFDLEKVPDPTKCENILKETGRGLHIIKSFANCVRFNEKGNSLSFEMVCK